MLGRERKFDYFAKFIQMSSTCEEGARLLKEILEEYDPVGLKESTEKMKDLVEESEKIKHSVVNQLVVEFIPPIEREDILSLSHGLHDVLENIEDVILGLYMFRVRDLIPEILEFTSYIENGVEKIRELLVEFENFKKSKNMKDKVLEINRIKEKADLLYVNAMRDLYDYSKSFDPRMIITWTRLLDRLERTIGSIVKAANQIEIIVLKNR